MASKYRMSESQRGGSFPFSFDFLFFPLYHSHSAYYLIRAPGIKSLFKMKDKRVIMATLAIIYSILTDYSSPTV